MAEKIMFATIPMKKTSKLSTHHSLLQIINRQPVVQTHTSLETQRTRTIILSVGAITHPSPVTTISPKSERITLTIRISIYFIPESGIQEDKFLLNAICIVCNFFFENKCILVYVIKF